MSLASEFSGVSLLDIKQGLESTVFVFLLFSHKRGLVLVCFLESHTCLFFCCSLTKGWLLILLFSVLFHSVLTPKPRTSAPRAFVGRTKALADLAMALLSNADATTTADTRPDLITLAQMWGTGKTFFVQNFLSQLYQPQFLDTFLTKLSPSQSETLRSWRDLVYVQVDFSKHAVPFADWQTNFHAAITRAISNVFVKRIAWPTISSANLVDEVENVHQRRPLFLHFDECGAFAEGDIDALRALWSLYIYPLQRRGINVVCSGRSPTLYALGRGGFPNSVSRSPAKSVCVLLDPLTSADVRELVVASIKAVSTVDSKYADAATSLILQRTSGVARFVAHAIQLLENSGHSVESLSVKLSCESFLDYLRDKMHPDHLFPQKNLPSEQQTLFYEWLRVAALRIPVPSTLPLDGKAWGLSPTDADTPFGALEVASTFGFYLEQGVPTGMSVLVFPQVMADSIAQTTDNPRISFWQRYSSMERGVSGDLLERIGTSAVRLRLSSTLIDCGKLPLSKLFPGLATTCVSDHVVGPLRGTGIHPFPKVTKSGKVLDEQAFRQAFAAYLDDFDGRIKLDTMRPEHRHVAAELMHCGVVYCPEAKSGCADLIVKTTAGSIVEWQFKDGKQQVDAALLKKETSKCLSGNGRKVVLVVVCLGGVDRKLQGSYAEAPDDGSCLVYRSGQLCGSSWVVPNNIEIVVLLPRGLEDYLTPSGVKFLKAPGTLVGIGALLASPQKKGTTNEGNGGRRGFDKDDGNGGGRQ